MKISSIVVIIFMILFSLTNQIWGPVEKFGSKVSTGYLLKHLKRVNGDSQLTAEEKIDELKDVLEVYDLMEKEETN